MRYLYEKNKTLYILDNIPVEGTNRIGRVLSENKDYDLLLNNKKHKKIINMIKKYGECTDKLIFKNKYKKIYYKIRRKIIYG